ncbi:UNVERIFIED_CONTAM: hypothetical protein HDU68_005453 [Siphonaria sp. JEL0065]|nr:hypothetical protein HDU68_005453 [Siphonaria sp. JEL0065]
MDALEKTGTAVVASLVALVSYVVAAHIIHPLFISPIGKLPGPKIPTSYFFLVGHMPILTQSELGLQLSKWARQYGPLVRQYRLFNQPGVLLTSPSGVRRVLATHSHLYGKNSLQILKMKEVLGPGVLLVYGEDHKRQRAVCNPSFRVTNINSMIPDFIDSAFELQASWNDLFEASTNPTLEIKISDEMSKPTLDVIGRCGFGYAFNSVSGGSSVLYENISTLLGASGFKYMIVDTLFPFAELFVPSIKRRHQQTLNARNKIAEITQGLVEDKKKRLQNGEDDDKAADLLTLVIKANLEADAKNRLSHEEVMSQVLIFLLAGHETTSLSLSYGLEQLAKNPSTQEKLRQELRQEMETKNSTPPTDYLLSTSSYLDAVLKETLRFSTPGKVRENQQNNLTFSQVPAFHRIALEDDVIDGYPIPKGTFINMSPEAMHKNPEFWGPDVDEFKPERWQTGDQDRPFGSFMPFSMGNANCIGSRFAMLEFKAIFAVLVRGFEFSETTDGFKYKKEIQATARPIPYLKLNVTRVED